LLKVKLIWYRWVFRFWYARRYWKLGFHLVVGTYYFGVNNQWRSNFPSMFGIPIFKRTPLTIYHRYNHMVTRSFASYAIPGWQMNILWPRWAKKFGRI